MRGRPKRAFSRAAVFCALRMAFSAVTINADLSCRVLAEALDLFLDTLIYFWLDQTDLLAAPAGHQLRRVPCCVKQQGFIRQRKIQRKKICKPGKTGGANLSPEHHGHLCARVAIPGAGTGKTPSVLYSGHSHR